MSYGLIANAEALYPGFRFVVWPLPGQSQFDALAAHEAAHPDEFGLCLVLDREPELRRPARVRSHRRRTR